MCCGRRTSLSGGGSGQPISGYRSARAGRAQHPRIHFQYVGRNGLSVLGPITGIRYRFDGQGAVVSVDPRDARSVAAVPNLRRVAWPVS